MTDAARPTPERGRGPEKGDPDNRASEGHVPEQERRGGGAWPRQERTEGTAQQSGGAARRAEGAAGAAEGRMRDEGRSRREERRSDGPTPGETSSVSTSATGAGAGVGAGAGSAAQRAGEQVGTHTLGQGGSHGGGHGSGHGGGHTLGHGGGPLVDSGRSKELLNRWQEVQAGFVDDPRQAAARADEVMEDALLLVRDALGERRAALKGMVADEGAAGSSSGDQTERMRVAVREYRVFVERLLQM